MTSSSVGMLAAFRDDPAKAPILADALEDGGDYGDDETLHVLRSGEPVTVGVGHDKLFARRAGGLDAEHDVAYHAILNGASPLDVDDGRLAVEGPVPAEVGAGREEYTTSPALGGGLAALAHIDAVARGYQPPPRRKYRHLLHRGVNDTADQEHARLVNQLTRRLVGPAGYESPTVDSYPAEHRHAALRVAGGLLTLLAGREHAEPVIRQAAQRIADAEAADARREAERIAKQRADEEAKADHAAAHLAVMGDEIARHKALSKAAYAERRVSDGYRHNMAAVALSQPGYVRFERPDTMRGEPPPGVIWHKPATTGRFGKSSQTKRGRPLTTEELRAMHKRGE